MALPLIVEKIDTIPEPHRGLYVEKEGKFTLDVDGLEDTTGLKKALATERDRAAKAEKVAKEWAKLGKTPDEIAELTAAAERAAEEAQKKAGKHDEILAAKLAAAAKEKADSESKLAGERDSALSIARRAITDAQLKTALAGAKATPEGLDLLSERLGKRVKIDFDDTGSASVSIMDAEGKPMIGTKSDGLASFDDLVKEAMKSYPALFEGTGAGGSGADAKSHRTPGGKTITRAEFDKMDAITRATRMKEGFKVVD
jgi:hypothetical protein